MCKKILVTGGSNGIGKEVVKQSINLGYEVLVFDVEKPDYNVNFNNVDVRSQEEVSSAVDSIDELDILINNAGVYMQTDIDKFDNSKFEKIFKTNVKGYRLMFSECLSLLKNSDDGNVVNVSSGLSKRPEPFSDLYSASKAAINCMKTSWANSKNGIRANCVLPGPVDTRMLSENFSEKELEDYKEKQPRGEFVQPSDVANIILFIANNEAFNGAEIEIGGESSSNQYTL